MTRAHDRALREKRAYWASFITYETFCKMPGGSRRTIHDVRGGQPCRGVGVGMAQRRRSVERVMQAPGCYRRPVRRGGGKGAPARASIMRNGRGFGDTRSP